LQRTGGPIRVLPAARWLLLVLNPQGKNAKRSGSSFVPPQNYFVLVSAFGINVQSLATQQSGSAKKTKIHGWKCDEPSTDPPAGLQFSGDSREARARPLPASPLPGQPYRMKRPALARSSASTAQIPSSHGPDGKESQFHCRQGSLTFSSFTSQSGCLGLFPWVVNSLQRRFRTSTFGRSTIPARPVDPSHANPRDLT
jgi:hypothetical protein